MSTAAHSVVEPSPTSRTVAGIIVVLYALISMIPLFWIVLTSFKSPPDSISYPPKIVFTPTLEGYCNLFTTRTRQTPEYIQSLGEPTGCLHRVSKSAATKGKTRVLAVVVHPRDAKQLVIPESVK